MDFRPISLCNVIYKLVYKVITNRLKSLMDSIISSSQSAFILGYIIIDNIIIAHEVMHSMKNNIWAKTGRMAVKLDMSMVYDRVEWTYLKAAMKALGFAYEWICIVMTCISTFQYSILVNDSPKWTFTPFRGLRQGDLLSPYLCHTFSLNPQ